MTLLSHEAFHPSVALAFDELLLLAQISQLPEDAVLRILQSFPEPLLRQALAGIGQPVRAVHQGPGERRTEPRRKVLRGGRVMDEQGITRLEVQVREISHSGCRIWSRTPAAVPDHFTIRIVGFDRPRRCEVCWREGEELGLLFRD
jgi:hypothetical protein